MTSKAQSRLENLDDDAISGEKNALTDLVDGNVDKGVRRLLALLSVSLE